ncbi:Armadillo-type fold [Babesia duncani]|uniref:Armadillo-type fold n=1 Tax=Babesia duncani TaxID=323732 RepID=A0AAD9PK29_9APIC|nr:Armadillo-type fold [Babesia duncani]
MTRIKPTEAKKLDAFLGQFDACRVPAIPNHTIKVLPRKKSKPINVQEGDLYSAKPVWQQLADLESAYKQRFKRPPRARVTRGPDTREYLINIPIPSIDSKPLQQNGPGLVDDLASGAGASNKESFIMAMDKAKLKHATIEPQQAMQLRGSGLESEETILEDGIVANPESSEDLDQGILQHVLGKDDEIDASSIGAVIEAETRLEPETWLNMNPAHLVLQQRIQRERNLQGLVSVIKDEISNLNQVNAATALYRIAKLSTTSFKRHLLRRDETVASLISVIKSRLGEMDSQGLCNVLWALVRLELYPNYMPMLLELIQQHVNSLSCLELACSLYCLSRLGNVKGATELCDLLVGITQDKITQFNNPQDLVCISTALARLHIRNVHTFAQITQMVLEQLDQFNMQQICGISWAFASLGFVNHDLFDCIKRRIEACGDSGAHVREIVFLTWALAKANVADPDTLLYTISPIIRTNIRQLGPREIATVAWAFVNARVQDSALFSDLAHVLLPLVKQSSTKDLTACVSAFRDLDLPIWEHLEQRILELCNEFTPLQLAKITSSVPGTNPEIYPRLAKACQSKIHLFTAENILELLVGFSKAEFDNGKDLFKSLLHAISHQVPRLYAEDAICLFDVCTKLNLGVDCGALLDRIMRATLEHIDQRVGRWRCLDLVHVTQLFECMARIETDSRVLHTISKQLQTILSRSVTRQDFAKWLAACSKLSHHQLTPIQERVNTDTALMASIHGHLASLGHLDPLQLDAAITLVTACIKIGHLDNHLMKWIDELINLELSNEHLFQLIPELVDATTHLQWVKEKLEILPVPQDINELVGMLWSCAVLGNDVQFQRFAQSLGDVVQLPNVLDANKDTGSCENDKRPNGARKNYKPLAQTLHCASQLELPRNVFRARQVALHAKFANVKSATLEEYESYSLVDTKIKTWSFNLISQTLIEMKIAHKSWHWIQDLYCIGASFPLDGHVIDLVTPSDLLAPHARMRAQALLRQRQIQLLGYGVASIFESSLEQNPRKTIAEALSGFMEQARCFVANPTPS